MFPVTLDLSVVKIMLVGGGEVSLRRLKQLDAAGIRCISVFSDNFSKSFWHQAGLRLYPRMPEEEEIKKVTAIIVADIPLEQVVSIVQLARSHSVLVNVEDRKEYCDFHFPSFVRRGDLLLSVSTAGKSPEMGRYIRQRLEEMFPLKWEYYLSDLYQKRLDWKAKGCGDSEIMQLSEDYIEKLLSAEETCLAEV